jgi:TonB family protein
MAHTNLLSETEVRVVVDPAGRVFSAVVLSGSGLRVADEKAVELARQVQFGLALGEAPPPLESGSLIFEWRTVDPKGAQGSP